MALWDIQSLCRAGGKSVSRQVLPNEVWGYNKLLRTRSGSCKLTAIGIATGEA